MTNRTPTIPSRRWRNVSLSRERDLVRTRWLWSLLLALVASAMPLAAYLVLQMTESQLRYRTEDLRAEHARLLEEERRLRVRVADLESPERVESIARRDLGLVPGDPQRQAVIRLSPKASAGLLASGANTVSSEN